LALVVGGCGSGDDSGSEAGQTSGATQILVDSDGGWDDMKAILYLLDQPDFEVVGIAVSGTGIAHCPRGAENFSALLERIGAPDIPVACGRETPLVGNNAAPAAWRSGADSVAGVTLPEPRPLSDLEAPDLLREAVDSSSGSITLVALGPLTNVAEAVEADPSFLEKVEMIYLMGGAVDAGGNVLWANETAEFNIWADPKAAAIVFATDVPITLVPLDATNDVPVTTYMYEVLAAHRDASPTSQFVADYLDASPLYGGLYHWDELAAVVATDERVVTIEDRLLTVVEDGIDQGATVESTDGRPVRVAVATDRAAFEDRFYKAIIGTTETGIAAWEPDAVVSWDGTTCTYEGPDPLPDQFYIRLDNESTELLAFVTGVYDADATVADLEAARSAAEPGTPDWWLPQMELFAPVGGHDVWLAQGGPNITGLCFIDTNRMWEVAGPRLPE
jgi:inosine-uridine nucleoside N-ribohydrolase